MLTKFTLFSEGNGRFDSLFGDGIVERTSLEYLRDKVFRKKENPGLRSTLIKGKNHFSILGAKEFYDVIDKLFP